MRTPLPLSLCVSIASHPTLRPVAPRSAACPLASRLTLALVGLLLLAGSAGPAAAVVCSLDPVPGATLLLPYFEVDLDNPNGLTTLFSVNNASASAILTHVVLWSDLAVPILDFNVYLTGYDVQTINLRDVIVYGNLPQTAPRGQDPVDTISPKGPFSQDASFPGCQGNLPLPPLPFSYLQHVQFSLTGKSSALLNGLCAGQALGDNVARGYVTVDTVTNCTLRFPDEEAYFHGDASAQNVLWGTWFIANSNPASELGANYVLGGNMVALEADAANPATSTAGRYTFYGRYNRWSAADHREPLATDFAAQYFAGGALFTAGTDLIVWRDMKSAQKPFACPAGPYSQPPYYPMGMEGLVTFDEQEHAVLPPVFPGCPTPPNYLSFFPAATQKVRVNSAALPVPFRFGWLYIDLNTAFAPDSPPVDTFASQGYVLSAHVANGHAAAIEAYRLDSACNALHFFPHY